MRGRTARAARERYWFFAGKGGVGKTTCAAAAAVALAETGQAVLLVSVDPAHSLSDALGRPLGRAPRRVPVRAGRLDAVELDADGALRRWLAARRGALERVLARGTYLDDDDVRALLRLSVPGVDELIGLVELTRLGRARAHDAVVVDTAPTGHFLRLLGMPETLARMAAALDDMHAKHRYLADSLGGRYRPDASDAVIAEIGAEARSLGALVRDPARCRFTWVLLPEPLALAEARDGAAELAAAGIPLADAVVNRMSRPAPGCAACGVRAAHEGAAAGEARRAFAGRPVRELPALAAEPRGVAGLRGLGRRLLAEPAPAPAARPRAPRARVGPGRAAGGPVPWLDRLAPAGVAVLLFAGKGGVGKTTCAAATALALAEREPGRVLLVSVDPAHSVADVLGHAVDAAPRRVPGTALDAREIDAARLLAGRRRRYVRAVDRAFDAIRGGSRFEVSFDRAVMERLIDLAPPGLDELLGLLEVGAALRERPGAAPYARVVLDTAPTGHTLRLLAMPQLGLEWVHTFMALWLKYRAVIGLGELGWDLVALSRELKALRELLADPRRARVVAVTRPGHLPTAETRRLLARLRRLGVAVGAVVVNAVAAGGCRHGAGTGAAERRALAEWRRRTRAGVAAHAVLAAPRISPPPRGPAALAGWARTWSAVS